VPSKKSISNIEHCPSWRNKWSKLIGKKPGVEPGVVVYIYNASTWEVEAGGSQVQCHPGLKSWPRPDQP
jgi:hypothetical protein